MKRYKFIQEGLVHNTIRDFRVPYTVNDHKKAVLGKALAENIEDFGTKEINRVFNDTVLPKKNKIVFKQCIKEGLTLEMLYCKECFDNFIKNNNFYPSHKASNNCESGHKNHCTCDICFQCGNK